MTPQTEGTMVLDGLVEGSCEDLASYEDRLNQWVASARGRGLRFHLETDANTFSLLANTEPVSTDRFSEPPDHAVADLLTELLEIFPLQQRGAVFSTLRSREFRAGEEVQTLYAVGPDAAIHTRQRVVDAETSQAERPLTRKQKLRRVAIGAGVATVVVGVLALFLPVGDWMRSARDRLMPYDAEDLTVDAGAFAPYFTVSGRKTARGSRELVLVLTRGEQFPRSLAAAEELLGREDATPGERLVAEALLRGYVRCERFDAEGEFMGYSMERIAGLRVADEVEMRLPIDASQKLARVRITY
ncbi:MAG: hypothetical protein ACOC8F_03200 [Planctomycetota bacterium]